MEECPRRINWTIMVFVLTPKNIEVLDTNTIPRTPIIHCHSFAILKNYYSIVYKMVLKFLQFIVPTSPIRNSYACSFTKFFSGHFLQLLLFDQCLMTSCWYSVTFGQFNGN